MLNYFYIDLAVLAIFPNLKFSEPRNVEDNEIFLLICDHHVLEQLWLG